MQRIMIVGISGAGKSTLGRLLGTKLGVPSYHLDNIYHAPGWVARDEDVIRREFDAIAAQDGWVVDGNYRGLSGTLQERAELVIFLDFGRMFAIRQVVKRWAWHKLGIRKRVDLAEGFTEQMTVSFIMWVWNWRKGNRERWMVQLATLGPKVKIFKNRRQVAEFVQGLRA